MAILKLDQDYTGVYFADVFWTARNTTLGLPGGDALYASGSDFNFVDHAGKIIADNGIALNFHTGSDANRILIQKTGAIESTAGAAVLMDGASNLVENLGKLTGQDGVRFGMGPNVMVNEGKVLVDNRAVEFRASDGVLVNHGKLVGGGPVVEFGGGGMLDNQGLIKATGPGPAVLGGAKPLSISSKGQIIGDVQLGGADDQYELYSKGETRGVVDLGGGDDLAWGGRKADEIRGGVDNDEISGGGGEDVLAGDAGHDWLWGDAGDDRLDGGTGNDRLDGGKGNDRLSGGLFDTSVDLFVFRGRSPGNDVITDFEDLVDLISLAAYTLDAGEQAAFLANAIGANKKGAAVIDLSFLPGVSEGRITLLGVAPGDIDHADIVF